MTAADDPHRTAVRGAFVPLAYRLGRVAASGMLAASPGAGRGEVFVLRRGAVVCGEGEPARRAAIARLAAAVGQPRLTASFEPGLAACPPGAQAPLPLASWLRGHLEAQLDHALAEQLVGVWRGARLAVVGELAPEPIDEADRRLLAALAEPRRLDQIWGLARAPRFRLLAFLHFLRAVGALAVDGGGAAPARPVDPRRAAALRVLGIEVDDDPDAIKRAYRQRARALHPDLQPAADEPRRRALERSFAELTAAYEALQA